MSGPSTGKALSKVETTAEHRASCLIPMNSPTHLKTGNKLGTYVDMDHPMLEQCHLPTWFLTRSEYDFTPLQPPVETKKQSQPFWCQSQSWWSLQHLLSWSLPRPANQIPNLCPSTTLRSTQKHTKTNCLSQWPVPEPTFLQLQIDRLFRVKDQSLRANLRVSQCSFSLWKQAASGKRSDLNMKQPEIRTMNGSKVLQVMTGFSIWFHLRHLLMLPKSWGTCWRSYRSRSSTDFAHTPRLQRNLVGLDMGRFPRGWCWWRRRQNFLGHISWKGGVCVGCNHGGDWEYTWRILICLMFSSTFLKRQRWDQWINQLPAACQSPMWAKRQYHWALCFLNPSGSFAASARKISCIELWSVSVALVRILFCLKLYTYLRASNSR